MYKRKFIFLMMLIMPILISGKMAIGDMDNSYVSHMMRDEMMEEPCMKGPGMEMHKMGNPAMKRDMGMPMMYSWENIKEKLNLTEEQAGKFRKIYVDYKKEALRKRTDIEIAEMDLVELLKTKGSSEKAVEESVNKLESLRSNLNSFRVKTLLKTREFLSDEQYEDLASFILGWMRPYGMRGPWHGMDGMMECR